jgi:hypothetical protein
MLFLTKLFFEKAEKVFEIHQEGPIFWPPHISGFWCGITELDD